MHPPLGRPHPMCQEVVDALKACHEEKPFLKFLGACNDAKAALDRCFREEKEMKRKKNYDDAQRQKAKFKSKGIQA